MKNNLASLVFCMSIILLLSSCNQKETNIELLNKSFEISSNRTDSCLKTLYAEFQWSLDAGYTEKTKPFYKKAMICKVESQDFMKYIENFKNTAQQMSGADLENKEIELKKMLAVLSGKYTELTYKNDNAVFSTSLFEDIKTSDRSWVESHFPDLNSLILQLNFLKQQIKTEELTLVKYLYAQIGKDDFKFDQVMAMSSSDETIVKVGSPYTVYAFLAAYNSSFNPNVVINGQRIEMEDGVARYTITPTNPGKQEIEGEMDVKCPNGTIRKYPFKRQYTVLPK